MPLETTVNMLHDATHARLDREVIEDFQEQGLTPGTLGASLLLLQSIAANSEGCVDPKYGWGTVAKAILKDHPDLQTELWQAWEAKSFQRIRNLSIFDTSITL